MGRHSLGLVESTCMVTVFVTAKIYLALPRMLVQVGGTAAWMVALIAGLTATLTWWAIGGLAAHYPGKSLIEATDSALGPVFGTVTNLLYAGFFHTITFLSLRQFSENITATVLPKTPLTVITLAFLGVACYGVILGLEGIARVVWVITPFSLVALVTLLGGGYLTHHGDNPLFPFWGWGAGATVGWGLLRSADFAELLLLGLLVPHFRRLDLLRKTAWIALGSSVLIIAGTVVLYEQIFPWPGGGRISFPLLEVSRLIITGRWVQRLESIFFLVWVIMATLAVTTGLYATVRTLAETIGLENERHLVLPVALTLYSLAQLPSNLALAVAWDAEGVRTWGWSISIVLPLLTLLVSTLRRKGANRAS